MPVTRNLWEVYARFLKQMADCLQLILLSISNIQALALKITQDDNTNMFSYSIIF